MRTTCRSLVMALALAAGTAAAACAPVRLDGTPPLRGTVVTVDGRAVGIRHKTGRVYQVEVTAETRIVNRVRPGDRRLCPGQRATVLLAGPGRFTASAITLWSGGCR